MNATEIQSYLGERYSAYLEELPSEDWAQGYQQFCERTRNIAGALDGEGRQALIDACGAAGVAGGLEVYLKEALYERYNGVTSLQQGGLSQENFNRVCRDDQFLIIFSRVLSLAKTHASADDIYDDAIRWMEGFASRNKLNRFSAVLNRYFAGCLPGILTMIAAESHLRALITLFGPVGIPDLQSNWLTANRALMTLLTQWLDGKQIDGDTKFRRSIFFWWLYENGLGGYEDHQVVYYGKVVEAALVDPIVFVPEV